VPALEAWEKVFVEHDEFALTDHGELGCVACHGGVEPVADKHAAHEGLVVDPSEGASSACLECHADTVQVFQSSMHATLAGERTMIEARAGYAMEDDPALLAGFEGSCAGCHASCGACHVSRPDPVGGGLVEGHLFDATPDMINQCTACHGSRIGDEYRGTHREEIPGYLGDTHYLAGNRCEFCHGAEEIHGASAEHRYAVEQLPRCQDCHEDIEEANAWHEQHLGALSCQVCHAQDYKSCASCHVPEGLDDPSWLGFKIGRNPLPELRDETFTTLRHIPIARDSYAGWGGQQQLALFDQLPTWKTTSPHNIQRWTPRTESDDGSCWRACHESPATTEGWFLRRVDLDAMPDEAAANEPFIVPDELPTLWESAAARPPSPPAP